LLGEITFVDGEEIRRIKRIEAGIGDGDRIVGARFTGAEDKRSDSDAGKYAQLFLPGLFYPESSDPAAKRRWSRRRRGSARI
jgi:hypothetical protein